MMKFEIDKVNENLERTPSVLEALLNGLSEEWLLQNKSNTWSPYEVVNHLIHREKTDWIPRTKIILSNTRDKTFLPFDCFAQANEDQSRLVNVLLAELEQLRAAHLEILRSLNFNNENSSRQIHPE